MYGSGSATFKTPGKSGTATFREEESARSKKFSREAFAYLRPGLNEKERNLAVTAPPLHEKERNLEDGNSKGRFVELAIFRLPMTAIRP
jgi:hypothetical protein